RLNVIHMRVPPLRERVEDVPLLLDHFAGTFARDYSAPRLTFTADARALLMQHQWPGNVRELRNLVERLTVRHAGTAPVMPSDLPQEIRRFVEDAPPSGTPRVNAAEGLFHQIVDEHQSFWTVVYAPFMSRDLTRETLRGLVGLGLQHTSGSYRDLVELFHMA